MNPDFALSFFGKDPRSNVFLREGRVLRAGIDVDLSRALLENSGVRALMEDGALVDTRLLEDAPGGPLLEHRRFAPFTYPGEWSFSMLRDAALATLTVQEALSARGFELKDAHSYNLTFDGCRPVYVDFGSIVHRETGFEHWRAGQEYIDAFIRILRIWSRTNRTCALAFLNAVWARPADEALIVHGRNGHRLRSRLQRPYNKAVAAAAMPARARKDALARAGFHGAKLRVASVMIGLMQAAYGLTGHPFSIARLRRATEKIRMPVDATTWAGYQEELALHRDPTPRFRRIVEIVSGLRARDAFEIAGNQGALAESLVESGAVSSVICSDYDEHAIDALYRRAKARGRKGITPMVHDVMMPDPIRGRRAERLRGDVVIALAVTHHLLLTQGYRLDAVVDRIAAHGRRHLIIEFMPKGLWDGASAPPVPSWYTRQWFADGLARVGRIALEEQLEENRVMFLVEFEGDQRREGGQ